MNVLVAIDSWKGCLTSREVNEAVRCALLSVNPDVNVRCIPVSDGGEGFLDAVEATGNYRRHIVPVHDPLMRLVEAPLLSCGDHFVAELSSASGLSLLQPEERNPLVATSYGTGELIAHAIRLGARSLTLGLGGSAVSDCGQGMLKVLEEESKGGILKSFSPQVLQSLDFTLATDVTNPLLGPDGAVYTFARQKAAPSLSPKALSAMLAELEFRASAFAVESARLLGHDFSTSPGA